MTDGFDPRKSKVSDERMQLWQSEKISGNLLDVPGIGPAAVKKLADTTGEDEAITNTYQLFGKYLMLKGPDSDDHKVESMEHSEKFWHYLKSRGVAAHRSAIVRAVAEKAATMFPGIYDANMYGMDDDDDDDDDM